MNKIIVAVKEHFGHESAQETAKYLKLQGNKIKDAMKEEVRPW